jgi:hypothetical protein
MVFRPEGAVALRAYLQGAKIPADIYMLRKLQTDDPDAGPVTRSGPESRDPRRGPAGELPSRPPAETSASEASAGSEATRVRVPESAAARKPETPPHPDERPQDRPKSRSRNGVEGFLAFAEPFPPQTRSPDEVSALYAWMLGKDPVIPNNLARLEEIHRAVFEDQPPARLGYEQHILLLVAEDLTVYATEDALGYHLAQLAAAYRVAADSYRKALGRDAAAVDGALWRMASLASRMRLEAWVYHSWHGQSPQLPGTRQRELPLKFPGN